MPHLAILNVTFMDTVNGREHEPGHGLPPVLVGSYGFL